MKGFVINLDLHTKKNTDYRRVLYTGKNCQLVLMRLKPGEEIGMEVHPDRDQFFRFEQGEGKVIIDGKEHRVTDGSGVIVPAGAQHNVINVSRKGELKLYTVYSPPEHVEGTVRHTKAQAEAEPEEFDGKTTE